MNPVGDEDAGTAGIEERRRYPVPRRTVDD